MGRVRSGRVAVFLCACGHGGRGARLATVSLACWSSLSRRPRHARPAWRWSVRARSVHGHVASAVVVLAVCGRVSRLLVGLFGVRSLSSQRVFAQSDSLCAGVPLVAMLVGARCVGPARYVCTVRRPPAAGEKSHDKWLDRCKKFFSPCQCPVPCPSLAVLHAQSIIRYFVVLCSRTSSLACATHMYSPVGGKAPPVPLGGKAPPVPLGVSLCSPWKPQGVAPARWCCARARACLSAVRLLVSCVSGHSGGVSVSRRRVWWLGWLGWFGLCCGVGTLRPTWRVGLGVTHPCLLAGGSVRPRAVSLWPPACPG